MELKQNSSTNAWLYSINPTCIKPLVGRSAFLVSQFFNLKYYKNGRTIYRNPS